MSICEMKDSGNPWIGDIPKHWKTSSVRHHFSIVLGKMLCSETDTDDCSLESYLCAANIHFDGVNLTPLKQMWFSSSEKKRYRVCIGDLLVVEGGAGAGGCSIAKELPCDLYIQNSVLRVRSKHTSISTYLRYVIEMLVKNGYIDFVCNKATIQHFTKEKLAEMSFPVPPLAEQEAIAAYLDKKCAAIDDIIGQAKATIEEYKAWKASVIFEAVTKGLDPNAEMKDSGVEWIGDVPKSWDVYKTLYCLDMPITDGPHTTPDLFDDGIPFVSAEAVSCGNGRIDFSHIRGYISDVFYQECCKKYIPQIDDIYMIKSGATTGRVAIVDIEVPFTIWSPLAVFRANKKRTAPRFLFYFLQSAGYQKQIELEWSFGTQQNIGMRVLEQLKVCMPSLAEQEAIVTYLDKQCAIIDEVIAEKQALIEDLETYKKSLIYETVTGKRKES